MELKGWKRNSYHNIFSDDLHTQQISKTKHMQYSTKEIEPSPLIQDSSLDPQAEMDISKITLEARH